MLLAETSRRFFLRTVAAAGVGLVIPWSMPRPAQADFRIGDASPRADLNELKGGSVAVPSDLRGKVALLHFWASWCPVCRGEMTTLESIFDKYRGNGVLPCSIGIGEKRQTALSYMKNVTVSYPVLLDPASSTVKKFGISGIPTCCILDREGVLRYRIHGEANRDGLDKMVKALL